MNEKIKHDISTIDMDKLGKLPVLRLAPTYHIQEDPGNCCFLDPPGYPTYFTRNIYTMHGNNPSRGPQMALIGHVVEHSKDWNNCKDNDEHSKKISNRLKRLWKSLPLDHPRTRAWIIELYSYFKHCYIDDSLPASKSDHSFVYPVPYYKLKEFVDDERFSDEWRQKETDSINQANQEIKDYTKALAVPENHQAVRLIQKFYPEYIPEAQLIELPPVSHGNWWERYAKRPKPKDCPGQYGTPHPVNGSWCQMCGWRDPKKK